MLFELMGVEQMFDFPALEVSLYLSAIWFGIVWLVLGTSSNLNKKEVKEVVKFFSPLIFISILFGSWSIPLILVYSAIRITAFSITVFWSNWNRE